MSNTIDAIEAGDCDAALGALAALTVAQRRKLAPKIIGLHKGWQAGDVLPIPNKPGSSRWFYADGTDEQRDAAFTCVLAVATASELVHGSDLPRLNTPQRVLRAVQQVPAPWLNEDDLETLAKAGKLDWSTAEALVEAGLCQRPRADQLIESMIEGIGFRSDLPLVERLREQATLLEAGVLYRVFEVEGGQQSSLSAADKYRREENQWATALAVLSDTGELDRGRLIDGCLQALARDFAAFRAGWFTRFHDRLAPTDAERMARPEGYLRLLGSTIGATVSFGVKATAKLVKLGAVDAEKLLRAIGPALHARQKGTVKRAAKLLHNAAKQVPALVPDAIEISIDALVHPDADVQASLLDVIESLIPNAGGDAERLTQRLQDSVELVAASLRSRIATEAELAQPPPEPVAAPAVQDPFDSSLVLEYAKTLEEAVARVAYAMEHASDPLAQEAAFDAISRYAAPPDNWATLASPIAKRAAALWKRRASAESPVLLALCFATLAWTGGEKPERPVTYADGSRDFEFYFSRLDALADRVVSRGESLPLLSTPTHQGGFIEAQVLDGRVTAWREAAETIDPHDAALAVMRTRGEDALPARGALEAELQLFPAIVADPSPHDYAFAVSSRTSGKYTFHSVTVDFRTSEHPLQGTELYGDAAMTRWAATATPTDLQAHFARGVKVLGEYNMDDTSAGGLHLRAAGQAWVELGDAGHWLLMLSLAALSPRVVEVALDVAIDGFEQARVDPGTLGGVLAELMPTGILKAKRVAATLSQVAGTSRRHARAVVETISAGLRGDPSSAPRDVGALLSLLYELLVAGSAPLSDAAARAWLEQQERGGQVAKFRKQILAL